MDFLSYLLSLEMGVRLNAHNGAEGQSALVECLQEIGKYHDDQDSSINHPSESGVIFLADVNFGIAGIFGNLFVNTVIVHVILLVHIGVGREHSLSMRNIGFILIDSLLLHLTMRYLDLIWGSAHNCS